VATIKRLRSQGTPVVGYTWFPMFTMIRWPYRGGTRPVGQYKLELGLYRLNTESDPRWVATPLVAKMRSYILNSEQSVGHLTVGRSPDDVNWSFDSAYR
jgi:beta-glucosidase